VQVRTKPQVLDTNIGTIDYLPNIDTIDYFPNISNIDAKF